LSIYGEGLATEAIRCGNKLAFDQFDIRKLSGDIYSGNIASVKCYKKAGWVEEARLKRLFIHEGKLMGHVIVSCFNPKYFDPHEPPR